MAAHYSPEEIAAIGQLMRTGLSARQIAADLASRFRRHMTRTMVIGLVYRTAALKEISRQIAASRAGAKRKQPSRTASAWLSRPGAGRDEDRKPPRVPRQSPEAAAYDLASRRVPLRHLSWDDCRFPVNHADEADMHLFCGLPAEDQRSYCTHHRCRAGGGFLYRGRAA